MPNLQNIIAENEREISSVLESFDIREYEGYLEAREEIKKKVHSSQLRLIEAFKEMIENLKSEGISLEDNRKCVEITKLKTTELTKLHLALDYKICQFNLALSELEKVVKEIKQ